MKIGNLINAMIIGEALPIKIKFRNRIWIYKMNNLESDYIDEYGNYLRECVLCEEECHEKFEIIDSNKKIKKLIIPLEIGDINENFFSMKKIAVKTNELIDEVNRLKEENYINEIKEEIWNS